MIELASSSLSGTFFCVTTQQLSAPRTPTDVSPGSFVALKAYSTWNSRPSGLKTVSARSKPLLDPPRLIAPRLRGGSVASAYGQGGGAVLLLWGAATFGGNVERAEQAEMPRRAE